MAIGQGRCHAAALRALQVTLLDEERLKDVLDRVTRSLLPEARLVPVVTVGATDNRFFRRKGAVAYGYGLMSPELPMSQFRSMFHGRDERVQVGEHLVA